MSHLKKPMQGLGFVAENDDDCFPGLVVSNSSPPAVRSLNRYAIGSGFAAALVAVAMLAPQLSSVMAGDSGGAMQFWLDQSKPHRSAYAPPPPANIFFPGASSGPLEPRARKASRAVHVARAATQTDTSGSQGRRAVCVRLCDGYFFPVGDLADESQTAGQEAICAGLCPGAPAQLYVQPAGSEKIEDAWSSRDRKLYSALPVAFRHTTRTDRTCSCQPQVAQANISLLKDFTLRRGDSVATPIGIKVFRGAQHWPYKRNDFVSLAQARDLSSQDRGTLVSLERAAKGLKPAAKPVQRTAAPAAPKATPVVTLRTPDGKAVRLVGPQAMLEQPAR